MIKKIIGLYLMSLSLFASNAMAAADEELTQLLQATHSMQADFKQTILNKTGKPIQESVGQMALQRPGQFRWEVKTPVQQLIVASGKKLWIYDKDLEQITVRSLTHAAGEIPGLFLSDAHPSLKNDFYIKEINQTAGVRWFTLRSKSKRFK